MHGRTEHGQPLALECRGVDVSYGATPVLRDVGLRVDRDEVVAVLGPSGSGKTTLLHAIAGFIAPSAGEIRLAGRPVADARRIEPPERRDVGVVFQHYALWPHMTARDIVGYPLRRAGASRAEAARRAMELLERVRVAHLADRRPAELSGGEQQRVGLARALARGASLYLFDEPTAHLDSALRTVFQEELAERRRDAGAAAVYATHDAGEALAIADRVVLLREGHVAQDGTPEEIYERPVDLWAAMLTGPASIVRPSRDGAGTPVLVRPEWVELDAGPIEGVVRATRFRGPHTDYVVETGLGRITARETGRPRLAPDDVVSLSLRREWPLDALKTAPSPDRGGSPDRS